MRRRSQREEHLSSRFRRNPNFSTGLKSQTAVSLSLSPPHPSIPRYYFIYFPSSCLPEDWYQEWFIAAIHFVLTFLRLLAFSSPSSTKVPPYAEKTLSVIVRKYNRGQNIDEHLPNLCLMCRVYRFDVFTSRRKEIYISCKILKAIRERRATWVSENLI